MNAARTSAVAAAGSLLLGIALAAGSIVGPLALGIVRSHVSPNATAQIVGSDVVSLVVVAPLALTAAALWMRGSPNAPLLALAPALYAVYTDVQLVVGPEYARYPGNSEFAFPLYAGTIVLGWAVAIAAWPQARTRRLGDRARRLLGITLLLVALAFSAAWTSSIAAVLGGHPPAGYADDTTLFWLIRLMDVAFIIPASFVTAAGLLRGQSWADAPAMALAGLQACVLASVAAMALAMLRNHDPSATLATTSIVVALALALAAVYLICLRSAIPANDAPPCHPERSRGIATNVHD